jgi:hypothetical protein
MWVIVTCQLNQKILFNILASTIADLRSNHSSAILPIPGFTWSLGKAKRLRPVVDVVSVSSASSIVL